MPRKRKQNKPVDELMGIAQFELTPDLKLSEEVVRQTRPVSRLAREKKTSKNELDKLIELDAEQNLPVFARHALVTGHVVQKADKTVQHTVAARPSRHIIDLRKKYLIEKNNLHTIDRPIVRHSIVERIFKKERVRWHIPERVTRKRVEHSYRERVDKDSSNIGQILSMRSYASFCFILIVLLVPIPGIRFLGYLLNAKSDLMRTGLSAFSNLQAGVVNFDATKYDLAATQLQNATTDFTALSQSLTQFASKFNHVAYTIPYFRKQLKLAQAVAEVGTEASALGADLSQSLSTQLSGEGISDALASLGSHFRAIHRSLAGVRSQVLSFSRQGIAPEANDALTFIQDNFDTIIDGSDRMARVSEVLHHITGGSHYARYLVVFQNDRELRPTGGFIGSYALVDFARNTVQHIEFPGGGSYELAGGFKKHLIPPQPISVLNPEWFLWDSNWWYDFPTSARKIAWFYDQSGGPTVDGVIAVNASVVQQLLVTVGPVELPEYGVTVTADNFYNVIQQEVEVNYDKTENQPKKILNDLMPVLLERLISAANYREVLASLLSSLRSKDIQLAVFDDPAIASEVRDLGWDGHSSDTSRDYLAVITTNIAGGKSDGSIFDTIDHEVTVQQTGDIVVTARIKREHRADPSDPFAYVNHVDYVRMYVPLGSTLLTAAGFEKPADSYFRASPDEAVPDEDLVRISGSQSVDVVTGVTIGQELNKTVFSHWMQVKPGDTKVASISYRLPFRLRLGPLTGVRWLSDWGLPATDQVDNYTVLFQKQSGKHNVILNSSVKLADKYRLLWSDAVEPSLQGYANNLYTYTASLKTDTSYALLLGPSESKNGKP